MLTNFNAEEVLTRIFERPKYHFRLYGSYGNCMVVPGSTKQDSTHMCVAAGTNQLHVVSRKPHGGTGNGEGKMCDSERDPRFHVKIVSSVDLSKTLLHTAAC